MSTKPKTVGRYRRLEKIGYGNFGVVYKGLDQATNRVVAIKTLDLDAVNDDVESVQREVELLAHLSQKESSNVTTYYGSVLDGSKLWIVMDLCSGGSVRTLLRAGTLEDKYLGVIFREITVAVKAIHAEGIIHRDLKAANVLITMNGQLKLCDFGVAAHSQVGIQAKRMTIVGTPYWMAPEVISEGRSYTNKADIWSLGITFYEIVTGNPPYSEHEAMRALMLITNSRPPRLEGPKYAPNLKDLIALCLDEDPDARPTAADILKHKFIRQYIKLGTSILRDLVERYVVWKKKHHHNHRDSLLMFNPHKNNDDDACDDNDDKEDDSQIKANNSQSHKNNDDDDDADSIWDFRADDETSFATDIDDDLGTAPDSLRTLFGIAPKQDNEFVWPLIRARTDSIKDQQPSQSRPSPQLSQDNISPHHTPFIATASQSLPHLNDKSNNNTFMFPPVNVSSVLNHSSGSEGTNITTTVQLPAQSTPQHEKPALTKNPTAVTVSLSRSTTVNTSSSVSVGNWSGWRSRHGSETNLDKQPMSRHKIATSEVELPSNEHDSEQPIHGLARHSSFSEPLKTPAPTVTPAHLGTVPSVVPYPVLSSPSVNAQSPVVSPQKVIGNEHSTSVTSKQRAALPRLQMPPRVAATSPSIVPGAVHKIGTQISLPRRKRSNNAQFPPMPRLDSTAFLDSAPDELVVDTLFELVSGYRSAINCINTLLET